MTTYAIIPARGGSKGVPGKNIKLLWGFPLIAYSVVAARLASGIDRVVISTDSEEIADVAKKYGAEVPFIRPAELAQDRSPDRDFVAHAIEWFETHEGKIPDLLVHLRPTTPLRDPVVVSDAVKAFASCLEATSLRSAHPCPESPFKWFILKEDGYYTGIQTDDMDLLNQPRQMFPTVYVPDGYVDVLRTSFVTSSHTIHGKKVLGFVSPVCREVDIFEDFQALEFQLQREGSPLLEYLKKNFTQEV
jgi:N-acylneuraminate cytidylyltransferase